MARALSEFIKDITNCLEQKIAYKAKIKIVLILFPKTLFQAFFNGTGYSSYERLLATTRGLKGAVLWGLWLISVF